jgi:hypothetical protein
MRCYSQDGTNKNKRDKQQSITAREEREDAVSNKSNTTNGNIIHETTIK